MSRILFKAEIHGKSFPIAIGWDRRQGQCFVSVSDVDLDDEDYEDDRFDAVLDASASGLRQHLSVEDCQAILVAGGITAPQGTYELLRQHVESDAGNLIVELDAAGQQTVIFDEAKETSSQLVEKV